MQINLYLHKPCSFIHLFPAKRNAVQMLLSRFTLFFDFDNPIWVISWINQIIQGNESRLVAQCL